MDVFMRTTPLWKLSILLGLFGFRIFRRHRGTNCLRISRRWSSDFSVLGGVILTLWVNARLARAQHAVTANLAIEQHNRDIELRRRILRNGLLSEIASTKTNLELNLKRIEDISPDSQYFLQGLPSLEIAHDLLKEVGLLDDIEISRVVDCISAITGLRYRLSRSDKSEDIRVAQIDIALLEAVKELTETTLMSVTSAKKELEDALDHAPHSAKA